MDKDFYKTYFKVEETHWWFQGRRRLIQWLLSVYFKKNNNPKILDFGSGSGYLVGVLQNSGYDAFGTDFSQEAIEFGRKKGIKNLSVNNGHHIDSEDASFDCVLCLDTVEHIEDDAGIVKEIERVLKPGGYVILTVPAYQWLWGVQDEVAKHYRRYTISNFVSLWRNNTRLKVVQKTYFNTFLFPVIAGVRLISRWFGLNGRESDFDIHSNSLNSLLSLIFRTELWLLRFIRYPFGVSILLILAKYE